MKRFITGFLVGALMFGMIGAAAVSYVANSADFKVMVNGKEFISDPPALVVEGKTYLPLRSMGEALGVPVNWNEELRQAEVGNQAPVAAANTYSRNNPAPINTVQTYIKDEKYFSDNYSAAIRIIETIRGNEAWNLIEKSNMYNDKPKDGYEYIIAKVAFSLLTSQDDKSVNASSYDFDFYSENNEEYETVSVVFTNKLDTNLFANGNAEGYIIGCVRISDANTKVVYGLNYDGTGGLWFSLK